MSVTAAKGFVAAGIACGIKASGDPDLSLVATIDGRPVTAAGVFTSNLATAAPVQVSKAHLEATGGHATAVVLNSGNANAATGATGRAHAEETTALVAAELGASAESARMNGRRSLASACSSAAAVGVSCTSKARRRCAFP